VRIDRSKIGAVCLGVCIAFFGGELVARLANGQLFESDNFIEKTFRKKKNVPIGLFDPLLGWKNSTAVTFIAKDFRKKNLAPVLFKVTYDKQGFRGGARFWEDSKRQNAILALGDSFVWGGEVSNEETWPSHLEILSGRRTLNAGVSVYGLDQMLLSLQRLLEQGQHPPIVIFSLTQDNIDRLVRTHRIDSPSGFAAPKPYFKVEKGELQLEGVPIPEPSSPKSLGVTRTILGYSALVDLFFKKAAPHWWYAFPKKKEFPKKYTTKESSPEVACLVLKKLKALSVRHTFYPVLIYQDYWQEPKRIYTSNPTKDKVLRCAEDLKIVFLDSKEFLKPIFDEDFDEYETLFVSAGHMSNRGNLVTAQNITRLIKPLLVGR